MVERFVIWPLGAWNSILPPDPIERRPEVLRTISVAVIAFMRAITRELNSVLTVRVEKVEVWSMGGGGYTFPLMEEMPMSCPSLAKDILPFDPSCTNPLESTSIES
jgi:hypothetical protein